jgi:hypothetical protein
MFLNLFTWYVVRARVNNFFYTINIHILSKTLIIFFFKDTFYFAHLLFSSVCWAKRMTFTKRFKEYKRQSGSVIDNSDTIQAFFEN